MKQRSGDEISGGTGTGRLEGYRIAFGISAGMAS